MAAIEVSDVPAVLLAQLRRRASAGNVSLNTYVLRLMEQDIGRPSTGEWLASLADREPVSRLDVTAALDEARRGRERRVVRALRH